MTTAKRLSPYARALEDFDRKACDRLLAKYHAGTINDYEYSRLRSLARHFKINL